MLIRKRNGVEVEFKKGKIIDSITNGNKSIHSGNISTEEIREIANKTEAHFKELNNTFTVEDVQDYVETELIKRGYVTLAKHYITYRYKHSMLRSNNIDSLDKIETMLDGVNREVTNDNSNKSPIHHNVARDYIAGFSCKELAKKFIPEDVMDAHKEGSIHFHDMDYSPAMRMHNCALYDIEDTLQNGTEMNGVKIDKPKSLLTATTICTQISMVGSSSQYGGQTLTLTHLAPFVDVSRKKIRKELMDILPEDSYNGTDYTKFIEESVEKQLLKEINAAMQTLQYQEITCASSNGQSPFITIFMYLNEAKDERTKKDLALLIEEMLKQRIRGIKASDGSWVAPVFPKLIYVLEEDNIKEGTEYYYLTELARDCVMKRMVPDFVSEKVMKRLRGECFSSMGCRSQLSVLYPKDKPECILEYGDPDKNGHSKDEVLMVNKKWYKKDQAVFYSRFNQGVVTINLPDVALETLKEFGINKEHWGKLDFTSDSDGIMNYFWNKLNERLELCHRALRVRHERLRGTVSNVAPILWNDGILSRLEPGETIDNLLMNGWSTISLGYAGLYETVKALTGESHTTELGQELGLRIMKYMKSKCEEWRDSEPEHLGYSLYGTPIELTTDKFAKALQRKFGIIEGLTDKLYVTNSYHIPVFEEIDAFSKLTKESPFQDLSSGGNISYVELPAMNKNPDALMDVIKHIYETNIYAEINTKLDHCLKCGFDGEINLISSDGGKFILRCPSCGNEDARTMYVVRRLCGYIGRIDSKDNPKDPNPSSSEGRLGDIFDRVTHL